MPRWNWLLICVRVLSGLSSIIMEVRIKEKAPAVRLLSTPGMEATTSSTVRALEAMICTRDEPSASTTTIFMF